jgi:hypothetical protein
MSSLTDSRVRHGAKACVDAVHRADYPKFNKCLLSQCEAPEKYGVQLVPEAASAIKAMDAPKNRSDKRRKVNRYYFRLTDEQAKKLDRLLKKLGYSTVQSFCEALIRQEVSRNGV